MKKIKVCVLMGGRSAEREVSLKSGAAVSRALADGGFDVVDIDVDATVAEAVSRSGADVAFIALHGGHGEDGSIQGMLEVMGMPYTGSGVLASSMAMDKLVSKIVFSHSGIRVPQFEVVFYSDAEISIALPVVVKPVREGSSIGVSIVKEKAALPAALELALSYGDGALVERYIKGKEVQIGVMGGRALGGVEVRPGDEFYSYKAKYTPGSTQYILPPEISEEEYARCKDIALKAHSALRCEGASRVDLIVAPDGGIYVLEVNTIPGMTETSLLPKIAALAGMDFKTLIREMVMDALERDKRGKG